MSRGSARHSGRPLPECPRLSPAGPTTGAPLLDRLIAQGTLTAFVCYDKRRRHSAHALGLPVEAPA